MPDLVVEGLNLPVMKHNVEETYEVSVAPDYGFGDQEERALALASSISPSSLQNMCHTLQILRC